ncbi:plasmid pRiA4b ORF-3 family protein [Verrucomicrobiales bacterium]|nr:plasmid pRiA4b ORF-3 family protein [Verrucomicrobiales bacterium]
MSYDVFSEYDEVGEGEEHIPPVSEAILRDLFEAASRVLEIQPWKRLGDTDWFAIEDPGSGTLQVVSIMGNAEEVFAIHSYLPDEGIRFWNDFIESGGLPNQDILLYQNRMVCCEFVSRDDHSMLPHDEELNQRIGLDCKRGALEQCAFRSYLPGCFPWFVDEDEANQLLQVLRLVPRFAKEYKRLPGECYSLGPDFIYPQIPAYHPPKDADQTDASAWKRSVIPFPKAPPTPTPEVGRDELFLRRVSSHTIRPELSWEIGSFKFEKPLLHDGRPRWYHLSFIAVRPEGSVHGSTMTPVETGLVASIRRTFTQAAEDLGYLPGEVCVGSDIAAAALADVCLEYPIRVNRVAHEDELSLLKEAASHLLERLGTPQGLPPGGELMEAMQELLDQGVASGTGSAEDMATLKSLLEQFGADELLDKIGGDVQGAPSLDSPSVESSSPRALYRPPTSRERFVFRVDLKRAKPPIWRRFSLPIDASFFDLHVAIQDTFGWHHCHLHAFELREKGRSRASFSYGLEDNPYIKNFCEFRSRLCDVHTDGFDVIHYTYDFGDGWEHKVKIEKQVLLDEVQPRAIFIKGRGACPPEDCGGIEIYQAVRDKTSMIDHLPPEKVAEIMTNTYEPDAIKTSDIETALARLEDLSE